jgi:hypothetical protein
MQRIYWLAENLLASQEGFFHVVSCYLERLYFLILVLFNESRFYIKRFDKLYFKNIGYLKYARQLAILRRVLKNKPFELGE